MNTSEPTQVHRRLLELLQGRYTFLSMLGRGGSGTVYEVRNIQLGRLEALKVLTNILTPETTRRFVQEARVSASLDHPGIVKVYDFGQVEGINWFSMQIIEGPSLSTMIDAGVRLNPTGFSRLAMPLLDALVYSHKKGVIHRDIKPANIMLQKSGYPILTDFGIAKSPDTADLTQTGNMMGTPAYMAPEQAEGKPVDSRTDQYSLAITLYRAVTGRLPFSSSGPVETLVQRLKEDPEPLDWHCPDFPAPLRHVLMKALSRNREDRFPSISAMRHSLQDACEACRIAWNKPLEGFDHLTSYTRTPLEETGPSFTGETAETALIRQNDVLVQKPDRTLLYVIIGPLVIVAATLGFLFFRDTPAPSESEPVKPPSEAAPPNGGQPTEIFAPRWPTHQPPEPKDPKPTAAQAIPRRAVTPPLNIENKVPSSVTVPPELVGKSVRVRLSIGEDGRVQDCSILDKDVSPEMVRIVNAIAKNMLFSPGLAEDGKPVVSSALVFIRL